MTSSGLDAVYHVWLNSGSEGPFRIVDLIQMEKRGQIQSNTPACVAGEPWTIWSDLRPAWAAIPAMKTETTRNDASGTKGIAARTSIRERTAYPILRGMLIGFLVLNGAALILGWCGKVAVDNESSPRYYSEASEIEEWKSQHASDQFFWSVVAFSMTAAFPVSLVSAFLGMAFLDIADCAVTRRE